MTTFRAERTPRPIGLNEGNPMTNPIVARARGEGRILLNEVESKQLLEQAGISTTKARLATSAEDAVTAAGEIGYPVVLKIMSPDISHKSDVGGVALNLADAAAVRAAFENMTRQVKAAQPAARINGVSVQNMARQGTEVIVGMTKDPQFGPVLMFGLGGIMVEILKDVAFRIVPITERDADQMIHDIKGFPVLQGVRGQEPADIDALKRMLLQLSLFVEAHPDIEELDLNPVFAYEDGALAVDARVVLTPV
jgi:acyl-CoA synthetase (NDP forming)